VTGGQYDVDVALRGPNNEILYKQIKTQFDSHTFVAPQTGIYAACFSNEFSTFSHKLVYMDFQVGDEPALPGTQEHATVMTQVCIYCTLPAFIPTNFKIISPITTHKFHPEAILMGFKNMHHYHYEVEKLPKLGLE